MNHLLQAEQLYVLGRRASFDFHVPFEFLPAFVELLLVVLSLDEVCEVETLL